MKKNLAKQMRKYYPKVYDQAKYIYAPGTIPICLVAHMDTVHSQPPKEVFFDPKANVFWSPDGLGGDDRAGVFAILTLVGAYNLRPYVLFTTDEETGGDGAKAAVKEFTPPGIHYLIQLDRRGKNDCVFYQDENEDFHKYVESFGFKTAIGSFSDISTLCPAWGMSGVNLSVGYYNEHHTEEFLRFNQTIETIKKVRNMLLNPPLTTFKYKAKPRTYYGYDSEWGYSRGAGTYDVYDNYSKPAASVDEPDWVKAGRDLAAKNDAVVTENTKKHMAEMGYELVKGSWVKTSMMPKMGDIVKFKSFEEIKRIHPVLKGLREETVKRIISINREVLRVDRIRQEIGVNGEDADYWIPVEWVDHTGPEAFFSDLKDAQAAALDVLSPAQLEVVIDYLQSPSPSYAPRGSDEEYEHLWKLGWSQHMIDHYYDLLEDAEQNTEDYEGEVYSEQYTPPPTFEKIIDGPGDAKEKYNKLRAAGYSDTQIQQYLASRDKKRSTTTEPKISNEGEAPDIDIVHEVEKALEKGYSPKEIAKEMGKLGYTDLEIRKYLGLAKAHDPNVVVTEAESLDVGLEEIAKSTNDNLLNLGGEFAEYIKSMRKRGNMTEYEIYQAVMREQDNY